MYNLCIKVLIQLSNIPLDLGCLLPMKPCPEIADLVLLPSPSCRLG